MENFEELDEFSAYLDDIWVFQLGEGQRCCLWAYDEEQDALTPLDDEIILRSENHGSSEPEIWLKSDKHCNWKLRKKIAEEKEATYLDAIATLIVQCSAINSLNQFVSKDVAIKLMDSIEDKLV
ncbi:hypothetical protein JCM19238_1269 [Vibrio ponticus]|nr:hypothetical protein JCM19238_1269 [Vibrio ponticus]